MTTTQPGAPDEEPAAGAQARMHGVSSGSSTFIQIGTQIIQSPPAPTVRYSLPPDTAAFTGRDSELDRITAAMTNAAGAGGVVAIHAIGGIPGIGKTALAVHVAHLLRDRCPDRQLFIDLHAHTPGQDPALPEAALAGLLTAAGVDARYLPADLEALAALWRDRMAGRRALLVLDNAASSAQVTPLLPGEGCLVLVTSRRHLGDLPGPVVPVLLEALPPQQAQAMFSRLAPRAATAPPAMVQELAGLAGYLPLAISLLARVYAKHPSWTLADLIRETRASLLTLAAEKSSIAAAFEVSYRYLTGEQQQFFRRLSLHPGTTIDPYAGAALAGIPLPEAAGRLDALHKEGLLTEAGYHRYRMHDLIRRYAQNLTAADPAASRGQGLSQLLDYYQHTGAIAQALLARQSQATLAAVARTSPPAAVPDLPDRARALAWARAERASLLACLDHATRTSQHARIVALTAAIAALLRQDGPWADAITRHGAALKSARHLGDQPGEASALSNLGIVRNLTGDHTGAAQALETALRIYHHLGDQLGQANTLSNLGVVRRLTGNNRAAAGALETALGIYRDLGDELGQANALSSLGSVRRRTGDYRGAAEVLQEALGIYRGLGSQREAGALNELGVVRRLTGDFPGAARALQDAAEISRELGDRVGLGNALNNLGVVRQVTGNYPGAADAQDEALGIYRDIGDRLGQGNVLNNLGIVRRLTGDYQGAAGNLEAALDIYRSLDDRVGRGNALTNLGVLRRLTGDYPGAAEALEAALDIFRGLGDRGGEAEALNEAGTLHRVRGDPARARACHHQALDLGREIGSSWDEANALAGLGRCSLADGNIGEAVGGLRQAQEIFQLIGTAEAAIVAAELAALTQAGPVPGRGESRRQARRLEGRPGKL